MCRQGCVPGLARTHTLSRGGRSHSTRAGFASGAAVSRGCKLRSQGPLNISRRLQRSPLTRYSLASGNTLLGRPLERQENWDGSMDSTRWPSQDGQCRSYRGKQRRLGLRVEVLTAAASGGAAGAAPFALGCLPGENKVRLCFQKAPASKQSDLMLLNDLHGTLQIASCSGCKVLRRFPVSVALFL